MMEIMRQIMLNTGTLYVHHTVSHGESLKYDLHCHNYAEVFFFGSGDVQYLVEGREYRPRPESVLLIPPGVFHGVRVLSSREYDRYALHFLPELLSKEAREVLMRPFSGKSVYFPNCGAYDLPRYFDQVLASRELNDEIRPLAIRSRTESLLVQIDALARQAETEDGSGADIAEEIIGFVNREYARELSLAELAGRFYLSRNHLNRVFRNATGTTVLNYINHKRVAAARQLLLSGVSAREAAERVGFGDYSSFFRQYKKILKHAPTQARDYAVL